MAQNGEKSAAAQREERILKFWQENKIFEKSEQKDAPEGLLARNAQAREFVFYDGPPFATGLPHYGHILASTIKDVIPRYKTMRGFRVRRRWGWDCHGLPLENLIEKELNLKSKRDIEELGVEKFNEAARAAVLRYADDWKRIIPRMGRWADMERDYKTMDASYTESIWWAFKELHDKGLIYEGYKSMHLCPRCGTTLSNFEVAQGYQDITDFAVTAKLELVDEPNTFLLIWTTTPWTLPGNMAAAVNRDAVYSKIKIKNAKSKTTEQNAKSVDAGDFLILAKDRVADVVSAHEYEVVEEFKGDALIGKSYKPPFDYFVGKQNQGKPSFIDQKTRGSFDNAWKIYHAPYVSLEEGTGAVHLAPAFGAEDMELAQEHGIPLVHHVDKEGKFTADVTDFAGMAVKPKDTAEEKDKHMSADIEIIKNLAYRGLLFSKEKITHSYPLCWRCDTPLLNYAASSWFVQVTKFRDKLVAENEKVHWVPKEVGEGRFGNWLKNARDWAISRARYWGAPLPVWKNEKTGAVHVMGSVADLKKHVKTSGNQYFIMRHGQSVFNTRNKLSSKPHEENVLTEHGRGDVRAAAAKLKATGIDVVIHSPLERTQETALLLQKELELPSSAIKAEPRLLEVSFGEFEEQTVDAYHSSFASPMERMTKRPERGETWSDVKRRTGELLYDLERTYAGKRILLISHNGTLQMLQAVAEGLDREQSAQHIADNDMDLHTSEWKALPFTPLPCNHEYELDLHRPYIDNVTLADEDGTPLTRIPDVFDCWFESGSMPYGEQHYPFENTDVFEPHGGLFKRSRGYPADFIAEGLDQTRGWFYSLIVLGVALFGRAPYKNVIVNGLVLGEDGQKMSKRLNNYPDPIKIVDNYGADSLRYFMLSSPIMRGEDLNFSEAGVAEVMRKNIMRLANVLSFYQLYARNTEPGAQSAEPKHVLDKWIAARFAETRNAVTEGMENYELDRAVRPMADFIDDLSTWYLRRSRDRFKGEGKDKQEALAVTQRMLMETAKLIAPAMPFYAESLYQELRSADDPESVHLALWPGAKHMDEQVVSLMKVTREIVSYALEARASAGIKVRQPLASLKVKNEKIKESGELIELIKDEVNVKEVVFDDSIANEVELDTNITPELKEEGIARDFMRAVQDMRKKAGLTPEDRITLSVGTDEAGKKIIERFESEIKRTVLADTLVWNADGGEEIVLDSYSFRILLKKLSNYS